MAKSGGTAARSRIRLKRLETGDPKVYAHPRKWKTSVPKPKPILQSFGQYGEKPTPRKAPPKKSVVPKIERDVRIMSDRQMMEAAGGVRRGNKRRR